MFKTTQIIVMATLCLNFGSQANAQSPENKAIDVTTKGIQIGQKVPDLPLLSKYKGKLIILDFWATWCSPCIAMIPKMEALQEQFKDHIQFIQVTYQTEKEVTTFLNRLQNDKPSTLPKITGDKELHKLFPHLTIPHYIWIDKTGTVKAITGYEEVNSENIQRLLFSKPSALPQKRDMKVDYDKTKPFLVKGNGGDGNNLLYHSMLTGYIDGIGHGFTYRNKENTAVRKVSVRNYSIPMLFQLAYSAEKKIEDGFFKDNRIQLNVKDSSKVICKGTQAEKAEWFKQHSYCYELLVPITMGKQLFPIMQQELKRIFSNYHVEIAKRQVKCMVLKRSSAIDKLKSAGGKPQISFDKFSCKLKNKSLDDFISRLTILYQQNAAFPFINGTGYQHNVDLDIIANLSNLAEVNKQLENYDLQFIEESQELSMLIISDTNPTQKENL